eukprot:m.178483 g.178483  ORF g.178483 m.178483 type:complete len:497 (+) comp14552_c0_seq1:65-1555(+)
MSLADELLADLEDLEDDEEPLDLQEGPDDDQAPAEELGDLREKSIHSVAKLLTSEQLTRVISSIDKFTEERDSMPEDMGPLEENPEYKLIVEANNLVLDIDNELSTVHKFVRDNYEKRFPELEQLVLHPLDYIRTVKVMQNQMDCTQLDLSETIAPATIMVVSVTASTTQGKPLDQAELDRILEACDMALALNDAKNKIFDYVESRMFFLAPNLTHIVGPNTAAKMLGAAGGLTALSKIPACNVQLLGQQKKAGTGFSAAAMLPNTGFVYYCDLVQSQPPEYRKKAARQIAAKAVLAARVDSYHDSRVNGVTVGITYRDDIVKKLAKAQEPPPAKLAKALPKPDMDPRKRRGGKRVRKQKERFQMSETRKAANRMGFGEIEEDIMQDEMGFTLGALGKKGHAGGHFRVPEAKKQKGGTMSKALRKRLEQQQRSGGMSSIRGLSTAGTASVAFTPVQGLEIVRGAEVKKQAGTGTDKYFNESAGFASLKPGAKSSSS